MESYVMEEKEKEIDLKQLFFYLIENIKWIIIVGILCGILLGGYGYYKTYKRSVEGAGNATIQSIIKQNRSKWYNLDTSVTGDAFNNPPTGACIANAKVYVDFNYSNIEGNNNLDFTAMNGRLQGDICVLAGSNEVKQAVIDKLNLHLYEDMETLTLEEMRFLIYMNFSGANILQISVIDINPDRAVAVSQAIADELLVKASEYETVDNIRLLESAKLIYEKEQEVTTSMEYIKRVVKYFVVGGLVGIVLMCGIYFLIFMFKETVRTSDDLDYIGIKTFGIIPLNEGKKETEYKRLSYDISFLDKSGVTIIPVDETVSMDDIKDNIINGAKKNCKITITENLIDNPDVIVDAKYSGNAILVATFGKTLIRDVEFVKMELDKAKIDVLGAVLLDVKHI